MSDPFPPLSVLVWGDFACFTRPELKAERVSYPILTPTAARGILEAICWSPAIRWRITTLTILRPIQYIALTRNERTTRQQITATPTGHPRTLRQTLALRAVAYIITAQIDLQPHASQPLAAYRDRMRRRLRRRQSVTQPYLGCREFAAGFAPVPADIQPLDLTADLGPLLHHLSYAADGSGHATPHFFHARLEHGVLHVPPPPEVPDAA